MGVILGALVESLQGGWEENCPAKAQKRLEGQVEGRTRSVSEEGRRVRLKGRNVVKVQKRQVMLLEAKNMLSGCGPGQEGSVRLEVRN